MPNKQTLQNREKSLQWLRNLAVDTPLIIGHDGKKFTVTEPRPPSPDSDLIRARFEVTAAFINGFAFGMEAKKRK